MNITISIVAAASAAWAWHFVIMADRTSLPASDVDRRGMHHWRLGVGAAIQRLVRTSRSGPSNDLAHRTTGSPVRSRGSRRMCPSLGGVLHVAPRPFDPAACPREIDAKYRWRGHKSSLPTWTSRSQPALRCQDFREAVLLTACAVMEIVRARRQASQFAICSMPRATTP